MRYRVIMLVSHTYFFSNQQVITLSIMVTLSIYLRWFVFPISISLAGHLQRQWQLTKNKRKIEMKND